MTASRQKIDTIPFTPQDRHRLLALEQVRHLCWQFISFDSLESPGPLSDDELALSYSIFLHGGRQGLALAPHFIAYLRQADGWSKSCLRADISKNRIGIGGAVVLINPNAVPFEALDALSTSELLVIPRMSATYPNGAWRIQRGDSHPLVLAVAKLQVWTLAGADGQPDFYLHIAKGAPVDSSSAHGVDLFTTLQAGKGWIEHCNANGETELTLLKLKPRQVLDCLAQADVACIDLKDYAISHRGMVALGCDHTADCTTLLQALALKTQP